MGEKSFPRAYCVRRYPFQRGHPATPRTGSAPIPPSRKEPCPCGPLSRELPAAGAAPTPLRKRPFAVHAAFMSPMPYGALLPGTSAPRRFRPPSRRASQAVPGRAASDDNQYLPRAHAIFRGLQTTRAPYRDSQNSGCHGTSALTSSVAPFHSVRCLAASQTRLAARSCFAVRSPDACGPHAVKASTGFPKGALLRNLLDGLLWPFG